MDANIFLFIGQLRCNQAEKDKTITHEIVLPEFIVLIPEKPIQVSWNHVHHWMIQMLRMGPSLFGWQIGSVL